MSEELHIATEGDVEDVVLDAVEKAFLQFSRYSDEPETPAKKILSNREARKFLDTSKSTLQRYRDEGTLPYSKVGGKVYYERAELLRLVRDHRVTPNSSEEVSSERPPSN